MKENNKISNGVKICICTNGRPHEGGMTAYINSIAEGFRKLGHQVSIVSVFGTSSQRQTKNKLVKISDSLLTGNQWLTLFIYILSEAILFFVLYYSYLYHKFDLIYAVDDSAANVSRRLKFFHHLPVAHNVQGSLIKDLLNQKKIAVDGFVYRFFAKQQKKAYQKIDLLIANSSYTKNDIEQFCDNPAPIEISRNLVNEEIFYPQAANKETIRKEFGMPIDKFIIVYPGRLVKRKGVVYAVLALIDLMKLDSNYYLVCAGEGPERESLEKIINENKLQNNVELLGAIPYKKMGAVFNMADIIVVPSITYKGMEEPLGITALEAMATGIPVIASQIGGLKEIIANNHNGLLVPEKNYKAIAQAITNLKNDPALREKLVTAGLREIEEKYTTTKVAQNLMEIFSKHSKTDKQFYNESD